MVDHGGFSCQSKKHASISLVPVEEVRLMQDPDFPSIVHVPSGKIRSLAVTPQGCQGYQHWTFGCWPEAALKELKRLNREVYAK